MVGENRGNREEAAAEYIKAHITKPVPATSRADRAQSKRMGHAGAIIAGGKGLASDKMAALEAAGVVSGQNRPPVWVKRWSRRSAEKASNVQGMAFPSRKCHALPIKGARFIAPFCF